MFRSTKWQIAVLLLVPVFGAWADEEDYREAIRAEIEQLRITDRLSVGEVDVASGDLLAEVYERRGFEPAWSGICLLYTSDAADE